MPKTTFSWRSINKSMGVIHLGVTDEAEVVSPGESLKIAQKKYLLKILI